MMNLPPQIFQVLLLIVTTAVGYLFKSIQDHEKRIQHIEDLHGKDIEELKQSVKDIRIDLKELIKAIKDKDHANNNMYQQQKDIIKEIWHKLEAIETK